MKELIYDFAIAEDLFTDEKQNNFLKCTEIAMNTKYGPKIHTTHKIYNKYCDSEIRFMIDDAFQIKLSFDNLRIDQLIIFLKFVKTLMNEGYIGAANIYLFELPNKFSTKLKDTVNIFILSGLVLQSSRSLYDGQYFILKDTNKIFPMMTASDGIGLRPRQVDIFAADSDRRLLGSLKFYFKTAYIDMDNVAVLELLQIHYSEVLEQYYKELFA